MSKITDIVDSAIRSVVEDMGYDLYDLDYSKIGNDMHLTIFLDIDRGIALEDCERVHKAIDPILEECDPTAGKPYTLNVSSLGLDRPLKLDKDYKKNLNKEIEVKLYQAIDNNKTLEGELIDYDDNTITLNSKNNKLIIDKKNIATAKPLIKF